MFQIGESDIIFFVFEGTAAFHKSLAVFLLAKDPTQCLLTAVLVFGWFS